MNKYKVTCESATGSVKQFMIYAETQAAALDQLIKTTSLSDKNIRELIITKLE